MKRLLSLALALLPLGCGSDTLEEGWYRVGSNLKGDKDLGGFGPCDNFPKKCAENTPGQPGVVSLVVCPEEVVPVGKRQALLLRLVNRTGQPAAFRACDSALYLVHEARDENGRWTPLEQFPTAICGNSFHTVVLAPDEFWELYAVPHAGKFKTRLRFRLEPHGENGFELKGTAIYSNEYNGSVDPARFRAVR